LNDLRVSAQNLNIDYARRGRRVWTVCASMDKKRIFLCQSVVRPDLGYFDERLYPIRLNLRFILVGYSSSPFTQARRRAGFDPPGDRRSSCRHGLLIGTVLPAWQPSGTGKTRRNRKTGRHRQLRRRVSDGSWPKLCLYSLAKRPGFEN
jgi:hypothetical protein